MKKLLFPMLLLLGGIPASRAQQMQVHVHAQDANASLKDLLPAYYQLKDALVHDDARAAATQARQFIQVLSAVPVQSYASVQGKLKSDAEKIAAGDKIEQQRTYFASLSATMLSLARSVSLSKAPVYGQYCPMKKSYWLSSEATVQNPFFGKQMLTCGKVVETIQPNQ